jgi:dihydroflavonol-4-reductase
LIRQLAKTDHDLYCLVRKTSDVRVLRETSATLIIGDVVDKESVLRGMNGCDLVIHLASSFVFWHSDQQVFSNVNIKGTRNVMESALDVGVSKVVSVSTAGVWGNAEWPITEETPFGSKRASEYIRTKFEGDQLTWQLYEQKALPLVMIYPSAVLGPKDPNAAGRYVMNFALGRIPVQVLTDVPFSWVHVKDVCNAILMALEKESNVGKKYIVSSENLTFGEINQMISEISGANLPIIKLPDWITILSAYFLTGLANLTKRPPLWDMSVDQIRLMKLGGQLDGRKAESELGVVYTPIRRALEEVIASFQETGSSVN